AQHVTTQKGRNISRHVWLPRIGSARSVNPSMVQVDSRNPWLFVRTGSMDELKSALLETAEKFDDLTRKVVAVDVRESIDGFNELLRRLSESHSNSWLGYQANVYYRDFDSPPAGARFDPTSALEDRYFATGSRGYWNEYSKEQVWEFLNQDNPP